MICLIALQYRYIKLSDSLEFTIVEVSIHKLSSSPTQRHINSDVELNPNRVNLEINTTLSDQLVMRNFFSTHLRKSHNIITSILVQFDPDLSQI